MTAVVKVVIRLKDGSSIKVENTNSWDNFMAMLLSHRAFVTYGTWIPLDSIVSILPDVDVPVVETEQPQEAQTVQ